MKSEDDSLSGLSSDGDSADSMAVAFPELLPDSPLMRSQSAFERDLPELLTTHFKQWVAYADGQRLRVGKTQTELLRYCFVERKLSPKRCVITRIVPSSSSEIDDIFIESN
jgi:hypothetical protein